MRQFCHAEGQYSQEEVCHLPRAPWATYQYHENGVHTGYNRASESLGAAHSEHKVSRRPARASCFKVLQMCKDAGACPCHPSEGRDEGLSPSGIPLPYKTLRYRMVHIFLPGPCRHIKPMETEITLLHNVRYSFRGSQVPYVRARLAYYFQPGSAMLWLTLNEQWVAVIIITSEGAQVLRKGYISHAAGLRITIGSAVLHC